MKLSPNLQTPVSCTNDFAWTFRSHHKMFCSLVHSYCSALFATEDRVRTKMLKAFALDIRILIQKENSLFSSTESPKEKVIKHNTAIALCKGAVQDAPCSKKKIFFP